MTREPSSVFGERFSREPFPIDFLNVAACQRAVSEHRRFLDLVQSIGEEHQGSGNHRHEQHQEPTHFPLIQQRRVACVDDKVGHHAGGRDLAEAMPRWRVLPQRAAAELGADRCRELAVRHAALDEDLADVVPDPTRNGVDVRVGARLADDRQQLLGDIASVTVHADLLEEAALVVRHLTRVSFEHELEVAEVELHLTVKAHHRRIEEVAVLRAERIQRPELVRVQTRDELRTLSPTAAAPGRDEARGAGGHCEIAVVRLARWATGRDGSESVITRATDLDVPSGHRHHDHLINLQTREVIEFHNDRIEALQREIARELGYELVGHRLELYGVPSRGAQRKAKGE